MRVPKIPVIAVVDDDHSFRAALVESLCSLGYEAREFASAEEFVAKAGDRFCDCVITDIHMPGMGGLAFSRLLSSQNPPIPVIVITAVAEPNLETKVAASGSTSLLIKPFEEEALMDCLQRALNG